MFVLPRKAPPKFKKGGQASLDELQGEGNIVFNEDNDPTSLLEIYYIPRRKGSIDGIPEAELEYVCIEVF